MDFKLLHKHKVKIALTPRGDSFELGPLAFVIYVSNR